MTQQMESLYGKDPDREKIKTLLTSDNVLQKGEVYDYDAPFTTTKADDYKSWGPVKRPAEIKQDTLETNIRFGSYTGEKASIQNTDYNIKQFSKVKNLKPPNSTNILVDLNPVQETNKKPNVSSYADEFNKDTLARHRAQNEVVIHGSGNPITSYLRATHFSLGSDEPVLQTEAQAAYFPSETKTPKNSVAAERAQHDKNTNNVFRTGDYNITKESKNDTVYSISYSKQKEYDHSDNTGEGIKMCDANIILSKKLYRYLREKFPNPRDPSQVNLRQAFAHFDKNGTGFMSFECLANVLKRLLEPQEHGLVRDIISLFDMNDDEKIDYVEFENFLNQYFPNADSPNKSSYKPSLLEGAARHRLVDEPPVDGSYQISTHFKLGETSENGESLYKSTFGGVKKLQSPTVARPLPPSQILPIDPEHMRTANSIQREDYNSQFHSLSNTDGERSATILANKSLNENASFNVGQEKEVDKELRTMSMTASSYQPKKLSERSGKVSGFQSQWNHLTTEDALPELTAGPRVSEQADAYKSNASVAINEYSSNKNLRLLRVTDEKTSHLSLGNASNQGHISEMTGQFQKREVNPDCPAAGIKGGPIAEHQHIHHSENQSALSDPSVKSLQDAIKQTILEKCYNPGDPLNVNLQKAFKEFDRNNTGKIAVTGLREACKRLQLPVEDATLQRYFLSLDKNRDGSIDYHEFADELGIHIQNVSKKGMASVMQSDYTPINERRRSQRVEIEPKKGTIPPHYFHMNHSTTTPGTTTQHDFTHPVEKLNWSYNQSVPTK